MIGSCRRAECRGRSGLSIGYASEVLRTLVSRGYAAEDEDGVRLADAVSLLKDWAAYYRWEDSKVHSFVAPYEKDELVDRVPRLLTTHGISSVLTLLAATDRISKYVDHDQVADVQLFLDRVHYPVRGPEAAAIVLRTRLTEQLGLSRSDADALRHGLGI